MKMKRQAKKEKDAKPTTTGGSPDVPMPGEAQKASTKVKWVRLTPEDVMEGLSPELREVADYWEKALSCPESEVAKLTPQQREWRKKYVAETWPLFYAMEEKLREAGNEALHTQAMRAIHDFGKQAAWFAKNTPRPFKVSYSSHISSLADVSCRYLQRLALEGNQSAVADLARLTVEMTETLTDLLSGDPEKAEFNAHLMRRLAARLPYWPMVQFRHAAANNHFPRVADVLELGKDCLINATEQANYSLQTPINRFVWRCLKHLDEVLWIIRYSITPQGKNQTWPEIVAAGENAMHVFELLAAGKYNISPENQSNDPIEKALEPYVFAEEDGNMFGMIHRDEIPIYKESFKLAPLTKANAQQWADRAVMPYIRRRFPDLRLVEELRYLKGKVGPTGKRYAPLRKAVIQAMKQLARNP
jgi:hypothetical protein